MQTLIEFDQALTELLASTMREPTKITVALSSCAGRILAEDVTSLIDIPGFNNSQVDGYAARSDEVKRGKEFEISQRIPAGSRPTSLKKIRWQEFLPEQSRPKGPTVSLCKRIQS